MITAQEWLDNAYPDKDKVVEIDFDQTFKKIVHGELIIENFPHLSTIKYCVIVNYSITKFFIRNCPKITQIHGRNFFFLLGCQKIEIDSCPVLKKIKFVDNHSSKCQELEITNCPLLEDIKVTDSLLKKVKITSCPQLDEIDLRNNQLEQFDCESSPTLDYLNLENNDLGEITISKFPNLTSFYYYDNPRLSHLDLSNLKNLQNVSFDKIPLFSEDKWRAEIAKLEQNIAEFQTKINQLESQSLPFGDEDDSVSKTKDPTIEQKLTQTEKAKQELEAQLTKTQEEHLKKLESYQKAQEEEFKKLEEQIQKLQKEMEAKEKELTKIQEESEKEKRRLEVEILSEQKQKKKLQEKVSALEILTYNQIGNQEDKDKKINQLKTLIQEKEATISQLQSQKGQKDEEFKKLQESLKHYRELAEKNAQPFQQEKKNFQKKIDELKKQITNLKKEKNKPLIQKENQELSSESDWTEWIKVNGKSILLFGGAIIGLFFLVALFQAFKEK